jgi:cell division protein FtsW (lipid II flippase)
MTPFEKIHDYTKTVCGQMRWEKAHAVVSEEIENHLIDQRNAYMADGTDEAAATDKAISQMGDPVIVGTQLDRTHRPRPQWAMLILIAAITFIGVFIHIYLNLNIGDTVVQLRALEPLFFALFGFAILAAFYFIDFTWVSKHPRIIYFVACILMAITLVIRILFGPYGGLIYEPLLFPIGFSGIVISARNKGYRGLVLCQIAFLIPALMMLILGSDFMLFAISAFVILCLAVSKGWFNVKIRNGYLLVLIPTIIAVVLAGMAAFNPSIDPSGESELSMQIKTLLAHSHLLGQGTIPNVPLDLEPWSGWNLFFMLTYIIFDIGWLPFMMIIGVLLLFIIKGFLLCFRQKSALSLFLSVSLMLTLTMPVIEYVLLNMGIITSIGSLPFFFEYSYISTFINFALIGMLLSVFRTGHIVKDSTIKAVPYRRFFAHSNTQSF